MPIDGSAPPGEGLVRPVPGYRPEVDGLRAIAVSAVLLFHLFPSALPGGFAGVDVFFVLSGYLITGILIHGESLSIREFYARRIKRIFPALFVVLSALLVAGFFLMLPSEYAALGRYVAWGVGFGANIALARDNAYFDVPAEWNPLLHLWSLGIEEQFYLAWPLLIAMLRPRPRVLLTALAASVAASLALSILWTRVDGQAAFYSLPARFWELGIGGLLAVGRHRGWSQGDRWNLLAWVGMAAVLASFAMLHGTDPFPGYRALAPVLGTAAILASGGGTWLATRVLSTRPLVWLGLISYPLYLWHWPPLVLVKMVAGEQPPVGAKLLVVAAAVLLAHLTWRLVEKPLRTQRSKHTVPALVAALALVGISGGVISQAGGLTGRLNEVASSAAREPSTEGCPEALLRSADSVPLCRKKGRGPTRVLVTGDSHAHSFFGGVAPALGETWLLAAQSSCPPLLGVRVEPQTAPCDERNQAVLAWLGTREAADVETVVLVFYFGYALENAYAADHAGRSGGPHTIELDGETTAARKLQVFENGLDSYIQAVRDTGRRVVLVEDGPEFPFQPDRCTSVLPVRSVVRMALLPTGGCAVDRAFTESRRFDYLAMVDRILQRQPTVSWVRALPELCDATECRVADDSGILYYADSHHLSPAGAARLAPAVVEVASSRTR